MGFFRVNLTFTLYNWYNSSLYLLLHSPFTFIGPYTPLKSFLSNTIILFSSLVLIAQVSHPYNKTGLNNILYSVSLVLILVQGDVSCFLSPR